jgi:two-component system, response regulator PdtaR
MIASPPSPGVLVVDDEPLVRETAIDILSDLGVTPYEAEDGDEALFLLAAHPAISVLLTDIDMPCGLDGVELAQRVHKLRPDVGIIITSGKRQVPDVAMPDQGTFLPKPYGAEQLMKAVEQMLAA